MESPYRAPSHHMEASRPSIGFPLGTALLLIIIFTLSGVFSCCYHWEKLRSLRRSFSDDADLEADSHGSLAKPKPAHMGSKLEQNQSLSVLMPGDHIPKFIAMPCPREPPRPGKIVMEVQKPPPKLPPIVVPLY